MKRLWILLVMIMAGGSLLLTGCAKKPSKPAPPVPQIVKPVKPAKKKMVKIKQQLTPASYHGFFNNKVVKVVIYVLSPNPKKWKVALLNANDILWELHYNSARYKVVFVAYGAADKMFLKKNNKLTPLIEKLYKHKVRFDIFHLAMFKLGIKPAEILPIVHITPDGIFATLRYEMMGYSLLKP